jgi:hypothetical protein
MINWARPTIMKRSEPYFVVPHVLGFKDVNYASTADETYEHLFIEFHAVYRPTKDPNELEMFVTDVYCSAGHVWPEHIRNYDPEADIELTSADWEKLLIHTSKLFPPELDKHTFARFSHFGGILSSANLMTDHPNLILMAREYTQKQRG